MSRVLVVDDEPDVRFLVRLLLEGEGHMVFEAATGEQALEFVGHDPVDVILLDVRLPGIDGWGVLAELREREGDACPRIVLFSAYADPEAENEAVKQGAAGYLSKPFTPEQLKAALRETVN